MGNQRAIIFLNGSTKDFSHVAKMIKKTDFLVGVDGGVKHIFSLRLKPDVVIGDMDSITKSDQRKLEMLKTPLIIYPTHKDETDSEWALAYATKQGYNQIVLTGFSGDRLDHMISNLMSLTELPAKTNVSIIEAKQKLQVVKDKTILKGQKGNEISLIPLKGDCIVTTIGLKWALKGEILKLGTSRGVSNVMTNSKAQIRVKSGILLVVSELS